jgi:hypothetical protein
VTVRVSANIHFSEDDVWHRWHPGDDKCDAYGALKFGDGATLYFGSEPALVDKVIAELVALKQEMDPPVPGCDCVADPEPVITANPPHHATGDTPGPACDARDSGYICNAQDGHDGPDHVAYGSGGQECHRWPVAAADEAGPGWVADGALWTNGNMRVERVEDDAFLPMVGLTGGPVCGGLLEAAQWCTSYAAGHVTAKAESDEATASVTS